MKLEKVIQATNQKKWTAIFDNGKRVSFGAKGYDDYTLTKDKDQRDRYRKRHEKDLKGDPTKPGYLSYYLLWGDSTSMQSNISAYKRKFNL